MGFNRRYIFLYHRKLGSIIRIIIPFYFIILYSEQSIDCTMICVFFCLLTPFEAIKLVQILSFEIVFRSKLDLVSILGGQK